MKLRSRYGGFPFLGNKGDTTNFNGPIQIIAKDLRNVMSSAAETELGRQFNNTKEGVAKHITLEEMGHNQGKTPVISDNTTTVGIANKILKHKRSKAIDMKFYWTRDREAQEQFKFIW